MEFARDNRRFGIAWLLFALAVALHVTDEATHDFLTTYNASVHAIRARLPFLPIPTFTFAVWLIGLIAGAFAVRLPRQSSAALGRGASRACRWRFQRRAAHFQFDLFPSVDAGRV